MTKKEASKFYPRLFFSLFFLFALTLGFLIIKPFLVAFLTGGVLAVLSYPLHKRLLSKTKLPWASALLTTLVVAFLILAPLAMLLNMLSQEAYSIYVAVNKGEISLANEMEFALCHDREGALCQTYLHMLAILPESDLDYYVHGVLGRVTSFITENFSQMIFSLPTLILHFFVMLFVLYYVLKDHEKITKKILGILPLTSPHKRHVVAKFKDVSFSVFYGHLLIAIIQGVLAGVGYSLLGIQSPLLWASLTTLCALLPFLGTALVWLPLSLHFLVEGYLAIDPLGIHKGVALLLYGIMLVSTIDNLLRPAIISWHADVHPVLVLLGVLGGLSLFGFVGLILGPVLLALLMVLIEIYEEEKTEISRYFA